MLWLVGEGIVQGNGGERSGLWQWVNGVGWK